MHRPKTAPGAAPPAPATDLTKPKTRFDEIVEECHAETRQRLDRAVHAHEIPRAIAEEHGKLYGPPIDLPLPVIPGSVPGGRYRRRYDWAKAAQMMSEGIDWRDAANAIGAPHKAMRRALRHSRQFRAMLDEERRFQTEKAERWLEQNLLRLPMMIDDLLRKGDTKTQRWLVRRLLGTRPNQAGRAFGHPAAKIAQNKVK
jgi:hypothetical protein